VCIYDGAVRDEDKNREQLLQEVGELRQRLQRLAGEDPAFISESREPRLRVLLEHSPDVITVLDPQGYLLYLNHTVPGRTLSEVLGKHSTEFMVPEERERFIDALAQVVSTKTTHRFEGGTSGGYVWQSRLVPLLEHGRVFAVMGIATDVTLQRRAEGALRESEGKLRAAVAATGVGLWKWDAGTRELAWDGASAAMLGLQASELPGTFEAYVERVHPEDRGRMRRRFEAWVRERVAADSEHRVLLPNGQVRVLVMTGAPHLDPVGELAGVAGGLFDVTQRKHLEEQLRHAQKMEALGQLTAGIAHNFNNMLTIILSNLNMTVNEVAKEHGARLQDAAHATKRAADMVRELMVFSRRHPVARKRAVDVREVVRRTADICQTTFEKHIDIDVHIAEQELAVLADPGQLEQVLLNICLNARDAFEGHDNTHPTIILDAALRMQPGASGTAEVVCVSIRDNGPGMNEDVRRRIFEPFFTTKEVGRGTGLGLATAYGIVTDHGGEIVCVSRPGKGATFEVRLPRANASSESQTSFHAIGPRADG
jgi:two-component system, cell cycle sensor histidine kinase and response regulator CckA